MPSGGFIRNINTDRDAGLASSRNRRRALGHVTETTGHVPETVGHDAENTGHANAEYAITKRGDPYLRTLLIQGAKSVVNSAHTRSDPISSWVLALKQRAGWQKAVVALANKNARILWAVMTKGVAFDRHHVSEKPKPTSTGVSASAATAAA